MQDCYEEIANCSASQTTNATNGNEYYSHFPLISRPPAHSRSHSHAFSLCFPFPWDSHGTHGNSRFMHTSSLERLVCVRSISVSDVIGCCSWSCLRAPPRCTLSRSRVSSRIAPTSNDSSFATTSLGDHCG